MVQEGAACARILIVEDNVDSAETMQMLLSISGHEARTAYDAASALTVAREFSPEVVLCDIGLPGKDGYAVARELHLDRRRLGDFIHELKRGGERGSKTNGDFTIAELRSLARLFKKETAGDEGDD